MTVRRGFPLAALAVLTMVQAAQPRAQSGPVAEPAADLVALLDQYLRGEFDDVTDELARVDDFDALLDGLRRDGDPWVRVAGDHAIEHRRLAAATFAMEAARAAERVMDWKWVQKVERLSPNLPPPPDAIWWKAPPLLLEWGCALMRTAPAPSAIERLWHMAAVGSAQRAGDYEFLIGSPWDERGNPDDEIQHLDHVIARFPDEPRFVLAQAIAVEAYSWSIAGRRGRFGVRQRADVVSALESAARDPLIAPEAMVRLAFVHIRSRRPADALPLLDEVAPLTRDPYVSYLASYFRGQALEQLDRAEEAAAAYRRALETVPRAQSATLALSAMVARAGRPLEATALVEASLAEPLAVDPWREYGAADNRFWPYLIDRLHTAIATTPPRQGGGR